jgi:hypothetical protein
MTARLLNMTPAQYRAGPISAPWLSQSYAHILISQSPLHAWSQHPKLGGVARSPTKALDDGTIIHKILLGTSSQEIVVLEHDEYRTNAAKADRDAVLAAGQIPIKRKDYELLESAAAAIGKRFESLGIPLEGQKEVSIHWEEQGRHGPVHCCAMLDLLVLETGDIYDFKSTRSATLKSCRKSMTDYGYYLQDVVYRRAVNALRPELEGRARMHFVFAELDAPYAVAKPRQTSNAMREMGESAWRRAVLTWEECLRTGRWPGPDEDGTDILEPMPYALTDAMERETDEPAERES